MDKPLDFETYMDELEKKDDPISRAIYILLYWGQIDGGHHKQWTIDQALRNLLGEDYAYVMNLYNGEEDYPNWDEGIAP